MGGADGEVGGIAPGMWVVEGCGGMLLRKVGEKWEKVGTKCPFFTVPLPHFFGGRRWTHSSLCENQLTALTDGKMGTKVIVSDARP